MWDFHRVITWLVALAPALLCTVAAIVANSHAMHQAGLARIEAFRHDEVAMEVLAELLVHLSTYGTVIVGFMIDAVFGTHLGILSKALLALIWMYAMVKSSVQVRRALKSLA